MDEATQNIATQIGGALAVLVAGGAAAVRVLRGASADRTAIADDSARRDHLVTLQAENKQLRERHDSMTAKHAEAMRTAGELAGKVEAQTATIEGLRAEVHALRELVARQNETIEHLQSVIERFIESPIEKSAVIFRSDEGSGSGPLHPSALPAPPAQA